MARRTTLRTPIRIALAVLGSSLGRALADGLDRAPILPKTYAAPASSPAAGRREPQPRRHIYLDEHGVSGGIDVLGANPAGESVGDD